METGWIPRKGRTPASDAIDLLTSESELHVSTNPAMSQCDAEAAKSACLGLVVDLLSGAIRVEGEGPRAPPSRPRATHPPSTDPIEPETCVVCNTNTAAFKTSRCKHSFQVCHDCTAKWVKTQISSGAFATCPVCRSSGPSVVFDRTKLISQEFLRQCSKSVLTVLAAGEGHDLLMRLDSVLALFARGSMATYDRRVLGCLAWLVIVLRSTPCTRVRLRNEERKLAGLPPLPMSCHHEACDDAQCQGACVLRLWLLLHEPILSGEASSTMFQRDPTLVMPHRYPMGHAMAWDVPMPLHSCMESADISLYAYFGDPAKLTARDLRNIAPPCRVVAIDKAIERVSNGSGEEEGGGGDP